MLVIPLWLLITFTHLICVQHTAERTHDPCTFTALVWLVGQVTCTCGRDKFEVTLQCYNGSNLTSAIAKHKYRLLGHLVLEIRMRYMFVRPRIVCVLGPLNLIFSFLFTAPVQNWIWQNIKIILQITILWIFFCKITFNYRKPGLLCHPRGYFATLLETWFIHAFSTKYTHITHGFQFLIGILVFICV